MCYKVFREIGEIQYWRGREESFYLRERFVVLVSPVFLDFLETRACSDFLMGKIDHGFDDCCEIREEFAYEINPTVL